jgi:hypothetical protein
MTRHLQNLEQLLARLERLEAQTDRLARQNRALRRAGGFVLLAAALLLTAGLLAGQAPAGLVQAKKPRTVEAEQLTLFDANGRKRVAWGAENSLTFFDELGKPRIILYANTEGGSGVFVVKEGFDRRNQAGIAWTKDDTAFVTLNDRNGKTRAILFMNADGKPMLSLQNEEEKAFFLQTQR